jgi:hypothetical protein
VRPVVSAARRRARTAASGSVSISASIKAELFDQRRHRREAVVTTGKVRTQARPY